MNAEEVEEMRQVGDRQKATNHETPDNLPALYTTSLYTFETSGFFTASYQRTYPTKEAPSRLLQLANGQSLEFLAELKYGFCNALDMDLVRGLFNHIDEVAEVKERIKPNGKKTIHYHIPQPIRLGVKRWLRLAGKNPNPRAKKDLVDHIERGTTARMVGEMEDPKTKQWGRKNVGLYAETVTRGSLRNGKKADEHILWLTPFAIQQYYWHRTKKQDHNFYRSLRLPISKVLHAHLDSGWFAAFSNGGIAYTKSYPVLCEILQVPTYRHESKIQEKHAPAFNELRARGYISYWELYRRGKKDVWMLRFYPGWKWFEDVKARADKKTFIAFDKLRIESLTPVLEEKGVTWEEKPTSQKAELLARKSAGEPIANELVRYFYDHFFKRTPSNLPLKAQKQASALITAHGMEKARYIVEYAKIEAEKGKFPLQAFGGVVLYEAQALSHYQKKQQRAQEDNRQAEETQQVDEENARLLIDYITSLTSQELSDYEAEFWREVESDFENPMYKTLRQQPEVGAPMENMSPIARSLFNSKLREKMKSRGALHNTTHEV